MYLIFGFSVSLERKKRNYKSCLDFLVIKKTLEKTGFILQHEKLVEIHFSNYNEPHFYLITLLFKRPYKVKKKLKCEYRFFIYLKIYICYFYLHIIILYIHLSKHCQTLTNWFFLKKKKTEINECIFKDVYKES